MEPIKILIVEDEPEMRQLLALELETEGYAVCQAEDGEAGLRAAREERPDLIISDVLMPKLDGNQFLKRLRAADFGKDIPFIILTARGKMRDYFEMVQVDGFIEKPFKTDEMLRTIAGVVHKAAPGTPEQKAEPPAPVPRTTGTKDEIIIVNEMTKERSVRGGIAQDTEKTAGGGTAGPKKEPARSGPARQKRILVLEHDRDAYDEFQRVFGAKGAVLQAVATSGECVEEAGRLGPDLIVLRNVPGKVDAEDLAGKLKTIPGIRKTPIIIYTDIGKKTEGGNPLPFVLNQEGRELVDKVNEFLEP